MESKETPIIERITLRDATSGDEKLIGDFFDAMGAESRSLFNRRDFNRRGVLKFCARPDNTRKYVLALIDGKMVGYFFFLDWNSSIPELGIAVRDDLQGRGVGRYLMGVAKQYALDASKGGLQLTTHVANLRAQTLYESEGFVNKGVCKNGSELFYLWCHR